ncbi:2-oxoglutarate dehydrogenase E1 component [Candidatus Schneideria nysicola]|uniref:2-oxoglutarate dehydrogenase E1 component n=1 Tax=Candidatus Schneideria nysicola TaxID=1081631 RepID=UPI001CAA6F08|nr:2-oxoglutarate dehydrogenase E1 component [Candidatus Schneideria nysicola]UAJ65087.1 2-oxoglutarate dehydrogenase E1 component [Candidatus Schneideria nysicola]
MQNSTKNWLNSLYLCGMNDVYLENLYEDYLRNPNSIDKSWQTIFQYFSSCDSELVQIRRKEIPDYQDYDDTQAKILKMIEAFRTKGHFNAKLDPLNLWKKKIIPELDLSFYSLSDYDLKRKFYFELLCSKSDGMSLEEIYHFLKKTYCSSIGIEYMHLFHVEEKGWIQNYMESIMNNTIFSVEESKLFLQELTAAEGIERYLSNKFPGAKRFSLEGTDVLIPMLKDIIRHSSKYGTQEIVMGMAHRGRLNTLVNVFGKKTQDLFDEFWGKKIAPNYSISGDVKYHQGFSSDFETKNGVVHLSLAFNPSHLEIISPVVMGSTKARIDRLNEEDENSSSSKDCLSIILHGDAAISGQGVVQETFNMSGLKNYDIGGTIHIVINNQIGFTTSYNYTRSTHYCTDITKMVQIPIIHVNADDLESVIFTARMAVDFRNTFKRDVIIDLISYRRRGHNESDDPSVTQPLMYKKINTHSTIREIYANILESRGIQTSSEAIEMVHKFRNLLDSGESVVEEYRRPIDRHVWTKNYSNKHILNIDKIQELAILTATIPPTLTVHPRVETIYKDRMAMARSNKPFDWGGAEILAYATLLYQGFHIRLSGEDTSRGTFFHRHAVIHDQNDGSTYIPLAHIRKEKQGSFKVFDSVLSEESTLAFEYGYAITRPNSLVIWEAQFGDFANGAQVVIDQFIASGEQKWGRICGLVLLLPHGYDGQGPEHSSARLERYLQLCAEQNMQICIPSTPAQFYHILRRQILSSIRKPLIIFSPKSLLRHPLSISSLEELANGRFYSVIDDIDTADTNNINHIIICSGKIYYDLLDKKRRDRKNNIAIIRIEQLYPYPEQSIKEIVDKYSAVKNYTWCQEEPENQGAWHYFKDSFFKKLKLDKNLKYVGRSASASPAVGYISIHRKQQEQIINDALSNF